AHKDAPDKRCDGADDCVGFDFHAGKFLPGKEYMDAPIRMRNFVIIERDKPTDWLNGSGGVDGVVPAVERSGTAPPTIIGRSCL
ncbi:MAG: hypothetical protein WA821_19785, partial [Anaerolineales bacterium]